MLGSYLSEVGLAVKLGNTGTAELLADCGILADKVLHRELGILTSEGTDDVGQHFPVAQVDVDFVVLDSHDFTPVFSGWCLLLVMVII